MSAPMRLDTLLAGFADPGPHAGLMVNGLGLDSRQLHAGDAFIALAGSRGHGLQFAAQAEAAGAVAVIAETDNATALAAPRIPLVPVAGLRENLGSIAARFYGDATRNLRVIGVTGTNGKTSTVQLLAQALYALGRKPATIGTLGSGLHGHIDAGERTTPDAISVQRLMADFRDAGASDVAMEVSSHALSQARVAGVHFHLAVFTNLTRDHLDYHGDMQSYANAKQGLFRMPGLAAAAINLDDECGRRFFSELPAGVSAIGFGIEHADASVRASRIETRAAGLGFDLHTPWGEARIESRLLGRFNVSNLLAVVASLGLLGYDFNAICAALAELDPVPGRMNRLGGSEGCALVVIDYAHTPDALQQALASAREHCANQLLCVFGCGGERDVGKRPLMAEIAERLADRVIVTDDNPRSEDGARIVADILAGFERAEAVVVERDRRRAIERAVHCAGAGDVVLIAGKGHEPCQEVNGVMHAFDDVEVARTAIEAKPC